MIEIKSLKFKDMLSYPNLVIQSNEMTFITGRSGVGKSVFMRLLNTTLDVDNGMIFIDGHDINSLDPLKVRQDLLLAGQNVYLFQGTIRENFDKFYSLRNETMISSDRLKSFLELVCFEIDEDQKVDLMSGGERQRVYLAIFISLAKKYILLDEPSSALDYETSHQFMNRLKDYVHSENLSAIIISHDQEIAKQYGDSIVDLNAISRGETL